jgi:hypothetical protein
MKVLYRMSDSGYAKDKPHYVNARNCFLHFREVFRGVDTYVIADNVSDATYAFLLSHLDATRVMRTNLHNAGSFLFAVEYAIQHFHDADLVYFAEDDYVHTANAPSILEEGMSIADYCSGYDHPDKYINHADGGPNPHISDGGELTRVLLTASSHWKYTNSCCMTFVTSVKTLKEDVDVYRKHCSTRHPYDYEMFQELIHVKNRKLVSPLPSVSTHGETQWLAKLIDWEKEIGTSLP